MDRTLLFYLPLTDSTRVRVGVKVAGVSWVSDPAKLTSVGMEIGTRIGTRSGTVAKRQPRAGASTRCCPSRRLVVIPANAGVQRPPYAAATARQRLLEERPLLQLVERLAELLLRVHHDRAVPRHRLLQRLARHQQEPDPLLAGLHRDLVAAVEQHQRAVLRLRRRRGVRPPHSLRWHGKRPRRVAE